MSRSTASSDNASGRALEHEVAMVWAAIELVASGFTSRVSCSGLRFASQMLQEIETAARAAGVRAIPIWTLDDHAAGITIEAIGRG